MIEDYMEILCDKCGLTPMYCKCYSEPKPDRPDREKIASILRLHHYKFPASYVSGTVMREAVDETTDQILALIPDIEQRVSEALEDNTLSIIEEAKREERERIEPMIELCVSSLKYCEKHYEHDDMARLNIEAGWQALKAICPECGQYKPDDDRVKAGMKCTECTYKGG